MSATKLGGLHQWDFAAWRIADGGNMTGMKAMLHDLCSVHTTLRAYPVDLSKCSGLALQRAGHITPVEADTNDDGAEGSADIHWQTQDTALLDDVLVDRNRLTEDGAEGIAITYLHARDGWVVKRRLQQGEYADWLMQNEADFIAVEVSGTAAGNAFGRLKEKTQQIAQCSLSAERVAIVVAFQKPLIVAGPPYDEQDTERAF